MEACQSLPSTWVVSRSVTVVRVLISTFCRKQEILDLHENRVDFEHDKLHWGARVDARVAPLSPKARRSLAWLPRPTEAN